MLEATTGAPSHRPRGGFASHGAIWQGIPAMEKLLTQLEAAKDGCPVIRASQDCSEVGSQISTIIENNNSELCVPPTRSDTRRGKAKQSQSPSPPSTFTEPIMNSLEYRMLCVGVNLGWKKPDEYYQETDRSPVYVAAVILHPFLKWKWLEKAWKSRP